MTLGDTEDSETDEEALEISAELADHPTRLIYFGKSSEPRLKSEN